MAVDQSKMIFLLPTGFWMEMGGAYPAARGFDMRSALAKQRIECLADDGWFLTQGEIRLLPDLPEYDDPRIRKPFMRIQLTPPHQDLMAWLLSQDHRLLSVMYTRVCLAAYEAQSGERGKSGRGRKGNTGSGQTSAAREPRKCRPAALNALLEVGE